MSDYSFENVKSILRISREQFDMLDKLDGKKDDKITESIFNAARAVREKRGDENSSSTDSPWNKKGVSPETKQAIHAMLDGNYTHWDVPKPQNLKVGKPQYKGGQGLPDEVKNALKAYLKDLLRIYQTTGKLDKNASSVMLPRNMKISFPTSEQPLFKYHGAGQDRNDYTQKDSDGVHSHKKPDVINISIAYSYTDSASGKVYDGVFVMNSNILN